ncbi:MAG: hypothetical protein ACHQU1_02960 [Gemmatimonadales bacterium]
MRLADFEQLVKDLDLQVPAEFKDGIEGIEVTPRTIPDPVHADVFTLGECVPHSFGEDGAALRSTVLLHHGSFAALARISPGFDWKKEAWDTLTHELRHHLEWRSRVPALERLDDAVDANYARQAREAFEPLFFLDGEMLAPGVTKVEDDVFLDVPLGGRAWRRAAGGVRSVTWHGRAYSVTLPAELPDVLFLMLEGAKPEPAGDLVLVIRRRPGLRDLWHRPIVRQQRAALNGDSFPA